MEDEATNENPPTAMEVDDSARDSLLAMAKAMEFMPWIGLRDSENERGVVDGKGVPIEEAKKGEGDDDPAAAASVKGSHICERVQWFPRGLPLEMAIPEGGYVSWGVYVIFRTFPLNLACCVCVCWFNCTLPRNPTLRFPSVVS